MRLRQSRVDGDVNDESPPLATSTECADGRSSGGGLARR